MGIRFSAHLPLLKMFPSSPQIKVFIQTRLFKLKIRIGALFYSLTDLLLISPALFSMHSSLPINWQLFCFFAIHPYTCSPQRGDLYSLV